MKVIYSIFNQASDSRDFKYWGVTWGVTTCSWCCNKPSPQNTYTSCMLKLKIFCNTMLCVRSLTDLYFLLQDKVTWVRVGSVENVWNGTSKPWNYLKQKSCSSKPLNISSLDFNIYNKSNSMTAVCLCSCRDTPYFEDNINILPYSLQSSASITHPVVSGRC